MRKFVLTTLAALTIGTAAFARPADAACWWNGFAWQCWPHHSTGGGITIIPIGGITDGAMAPIGRAIRILGKDTAGG